MKIKVLIAVCATLLLGGCNIDKGTRVLFSVELERVVHQCDKNDGIVRYNLIKYTSQDGLTITSVVCGDGARFNTDNITVILFDKQYIN